MNFYFLNTGTDWNTASNWSLTDGGAPANAVPSILDNAIFTINSGACTISAAVSIANITFVGYINKAFTTNAQFAVIDAMQISGGTVQWAGTVGWTVKNFLNLGNTGETTILIAGLTYLVKEKYIRTNEKSNAHGKVISSVAGTKAIFTVMGSINIGYVDFTDINASAGRTLYPFNGVISNCNNIISMTDKIEPVNKTVASSSIF